MRRLYPAEGCRLTQSGDVKDEVRVFAKMVSLAKDDSPENWKEVTEAEAEAFKAALAESRESAARKAARQQERAELEARLAELNGMDE